MYLLLGIVAACMSATALVALDSSRSVVSRTAVSQPHNGSLIPDGTSADDGIVIVSPAQVAGRGTQVRVVAPGEIVEMPARSSAP